MSTRRKELFGVKELDQSTRQLYLVYPGWDGGPTIQFFWELLKNFRNKVFLLSRTDTWVLANYFFLQSWSVLFRLTRLKCLRSVLKGILALQILRTTCFSCRLPVAEFLLPVADTVLLYSCASRLSVLWPMLYNGYFAPAQNERCDSSRLKALIRALSRETNVRSCACKAHSWNNTY